MIATVSTTFDPLGHETPRADIDAVLSLIEPGWLVAEIGVWAGMLTKEMADAGAIVFAVDHWKGSDGDRLADVLDEVGGQQGAFRAFCSNMGPRLMMSVVPLVGPSLFWAEYWPPKWASPLRLFDLVFIDADHRYEAVAADIAAWTPHIRPGGILAGHDLQLPGVRQAVEESGPFGTAGKSVWWRRISETQREGIET